MSMSAQERDVISGIFDRLKKGADAPREAEAEKFIADKIAIQPYAPYVMAQSLYVQEQAINNMQKRIEELEVQLDTAQTQKPQSGGFLSSLFGSAPAQPSPQPSGAWGRGPQQAPQYAQPPQQQGGPWGSAPQQAAPAGGGFMASAMTTAAGVAGGMLAANAISSMFSGHGNSAHAAGNTASSMGDSNAGYNNGYQDAQQDYSSDLDQARQDSYDDAVQDSSDYGGGDSEY